LNYLPTFYADAAAILNQAKRARFNPVVLANSSLFSQKTIELGGEAVEGILIPANYFSADPRPAGPGIHPGIPGSLWNVTESIRRPGL